MLLLFAVRLFANVLDFLSNITHGGNLIADKPISSNITREDNDNTTAFNITHEDSLIADTPTASGFLESTTNLLISIFGSILIVIIVLTFLWSKSNNKNVCSSESATGYMANSQYSNYSTSANVKRGGRENKDHSRTHKNNSIKIPVRNQWPSSDKNSWEIEEPKNIKQKIVPKLWPASDKSSVNIYPGLLLSSKGSTAVDMSPAFSMVNNDFKIADDNILDYYDEDRVLPSHVSELPKKSSRVRYSDYFTVNRG
jgi:hypothetical protein